MHVRNKITRFLQRFMRRAAEAARSVVSVEEALRELTVCEHPYFNGSSRPYVRWWWLKGPFLERDIAAQLDWLRAHGFGGVEIAWLAPRWLVGTHERPPKWLSDEWSRLVTRASRLAQERGLGCDFTFGSCWPFGGSNVSETCASQTFTGPSAERLHASWEDYDQTECRVVNHLCRGALEEYAKPLVAALKPALQESTAFFCDSLEIQTDRLWSDKLWEVFEARYGYRLQPFAEELDAHPDVRYDYRKLISETMTQEFYAAFTDVCHKAGACSRVQCHGSPTDLLASYAWADIPESETLLFTPYFSRIPASAAALSGKPVVSCETFTCIYGFSHYKDPALGRLWKNEDIHDLRLLADAVIANGVNHIVWHGMPYNQAGGDSEFYAAVHVGPDSALADFIAAFNRYLADVCRVMQSGVPLTQVAVYLPNEDNWMAGCIPAEERTPGARYRWEMRHVRMPKEVEGCNPLWISAPFLAAGAVKDGVLYVNECAFRVLYIDCAWLDYDALVQIVRLACAGLPVVMKSQPKQPGHCPRQEYDTLMTKLCTLPNVVASLPETGVVPFVSGRIVPYYWARRAANAIYVFLAHPAALNIHYPMQYQQARAAQALQVELDFCWAGHQRTLKVYFAAHKSVLLRLTDDGQYDVIETGF